MVEYPNSYRDCWPWPASSEQELGETLTIYRKGVEIFLGTHSLPEAPLTYRALEIFEEISPVLIMEKRWKNYQVPEMGDMNVATHSLRQAGITAQALQFDSEHLGLRHCERDLLIAVAVLHDVGELKTEDFTYDRKLEDKKNLELEETNLVLAIIDGFGNYRCDSQLKEGYLKIATSLSQNDVNIPDGNLEDVQWEKLNDIFQLYERYGYLITAIQQYPLPLNGEFKDMSPREIQRLRSWNRQELENALDLGQDIDHNTRALILLKNVLLNQWPKILNADREGIRSSRMFFSNAIAKQVIISADELMALNLDLSMFTRKS